MTALPEHPHRALGSPPLPRRRFAAPPAVRVAQGFLAVRGIALAALLLSGTVVRPMGLDPFGAFHLTLPGSATWTAQAPWLLAASLVELALVVRLGSLRSGSRRVILLVEALVIAGSGLYVAAGLKSALLPLVAAIGAVVMLRLDHVRHTFDRAAAARRLPRQRVDAVLYEGYRAPDPTAVKHSQLIGYRVGLDNVGGSARERSRT